MFIFNIFEIFILTVKAYADENIREISTSSKWLKF